MVVEKYGKSDLFKSLFKSRVVTTKACLEEPTEPVNPSAAVSETATNVKKSYYVNVDDPVDPVTNKPTTLSSLAETYLVSEPNGLAMLKRYLAAGIATF